VTVEYVLLLTITVMFMLSVFTTRGGALTSTFNNSAPRLGARVEKLIRTGEGFDPSGLQATWGVKK